MKSKSLKMNLGTKSYPIVVGEYAIRQLPAFLKKRKSKKVFIVCDAQLTDARDDLLKLFAKTDFAVTEIPVVAGEELKDLQSVYAIYSSLLEGKANRDSIIIALGGGSVGDTAGFVAATYMRGIDWVSVPTTLLAQVDSGVGGKTGINHEAGKNVIGAFHQPKLVICDLNYLKTLQSREMVSGLGEIVKYAIAFDPKFFTYLEKNFESLLKFDPKVLQYCIERSLFWKCKLVSKDEFDRTGVREKLNFGHTFAHALESATQYQIFQHGEAVILGLRFALALSMQRKKLSSMNREKIRSLLLKLPVPAIPVELIPSQIFEFMKKDKKTEDDRVRFVLLEKLGKTVSDAKVTRADLMEAWQKW